MITAFKRPVNIKTQVHIISLEDRTLILVWVMKVRGRPFPSSGAFTCTLSIRLQLA